MPTTASGLVYPDQSGSVDAAADLAALAQAMEAAFGWKAYTPTLTATGLGTSPTVTGRYQQMGKRVRGFAKVVLGASPSPSGVPTLSLPVTATGEDAGLVTVAFLSAGSALYLGFGFLNGTTVGVSALNGATGFTTGLTASLPFAWKAGDAITARFDYEAA